MVSKISKMEITVTFVTVHVKRSAGQASAFYIQPPFAKSWTEIY
jgi:hypothetical protein